MTAAPALALVAVFLLSSCGSASDPEGLSQTVAEAAYERDCETLYEHASLTLKAAYGQDEKSFAASAREHLDPAIPEGSLDVSGAEKLALSMAVPTNVEPYTVLATDPTGNPAAVDVILKRDDAGDYSYCNVAVPAPGDPTSIIGEDGTC